ncbi:glycoside hydrolase family 30 beta sandwich domain-containing protein [Streptomyces sp. NPDC005438]|uniref:glycoside hydrolase family 30 protein n=1 Tax=Streptomyces sp. NPDC005438 TaxID=3156880 RepID=UPI0033AC70A5
MPWPAKGPRSLVGGAHPGAARVVRPLARLLVLALVAALLSGSQAGASEVTVRSWVTDGEGTRALSPAPPTDFDAERLDDDVLVDPARRGQRFQGAGASVTESSAELLGRLPEERRRKLVTELFTTEGLGLSYLRQPLGASDFVARLPYYTYEDERGTFSVARDEKAILPLLREARRVNPGLRIMASPWSAPAWMKENGTLSGGRLSPDHYDDFADYLVRSLRAYAKAGVPVQDLSVANEPMFEAIYPSMAMSSGQQARLLRVVDEKLTAAGLDTTLYVFEHNWDHPEYPLDVLRKTSDLSRVRGAAFHCYKGEPERQSEVRRAGYPVLFTECSGTDGEDGTQDLAAALRWQTENWVIRPLRAGAETVVLWNLALDQDGGPHAGYCQDCNGVVEVRGEKVHRNAEYYALGHLGRFVRPGARRIASDGRGPHAPHSVAFRNPDGSRVLLVLNKGEEARTFSVTENGASARYELPPGGVATLKWPGPPTG